MLDILHLVYTSGYFCFAVNKLEVGQHILPCSVARSGMSANRPWGGVQRKTQCDQDRLLLQIMGRPECLVLHCRRFRR